MNLHFLELVGFLVFLVSKDVLSWYCEILNLDCSQYSIIITLRILGWIGSKGKKEITVPRRCQFVSNKSLSLLPLLGPRIIWKEEAGSYNLYTKNILKFLESVCIREKDDHTCLFHRSEFKVDRNFGAFKKGDKI